MFTKHDTLSSYARRVFSAECTNKYKMYEEDEYFMNGMNKSVISEPVCV